MKLSNYLGVLRDDPDDVAAYEGLLTLVRARDPERLGDQPVRLLEVARQAHVQRGEVLAVARLIEVEAELIDDDPEFAASLWKELGRLRAESLLDPAGAAAAYLKAQELAPDDDAIGDALKRLDQAEKSWKKFAKRFVDEAESATDVALKTSLFQRAGALVWQYRGKGRDKESDRLFKAALEADPTNTNAALLLEHTLREREKWGRLSELLLDVADRAKEKEQRIGFFSRAGRVQAQHLGQADGAAACYEHVLDLAPADDEAMTFLSGHYTSQERWDDLVAMYERALTKRHKLDVEIGILLQIGMVHWRMREQASDAEPYFARLRKLDAGHPAMLDFYRDHYAGEETSKQWMAVLSDAQRVTSDEQGKLRLALELARIAAKDAGNPDRAIDAWKLVLRLDPESGEAASALKALYRTAEKWNALADVIKAEIEAAASVEGDGQTQTQVTLLRELLAIYRDRLHMDGMVINTLGRIIKLVPGDRDTLAELATKYESAGRWNDLINVLTEDAEAITEPPAKVEAYLRVARLWIERFSNFNQATGPLEHVLEYDPENREALSQLKSIYEKKRAWKQLFEVLGKERKVASDPAVRLHNTTEMAQLAADRLHSYKDAIQLWRDALEQDPKARGAVEALEKLTEREKDWSGLVDVLERDLSAADSDEARIRVLQKLAALHSDKLDDPAAATKCWQRILEIEPKHGRAMRAIRDGLVAQGDWDAVEKLYRDVGDFEGLVDVLSHAADGADDSDARVQLSFRAARIFEDDIGEGARAVRSYERVLSADGGNQQAARKLVPLYEADEKWGRVRAMLDLQLKAVPEGDTDERLALLTRLRELCLTRLRDGEAGFNYAVTAYTLVPEAEDVRESMEEAAEVAAAHERLAEVYRVRAEHADAAEAGRLRRRVADLALDRLSQTPMAVAELKKVLQAEPKDEEVMGRLERLYRAEQRTDDLHDLLQHRLEQTTEDAIRLETLRELAQLEEEAFGDKKAAAERYRAMGELDASDREVLSARDRLATELERWEELAEVLESRLDAETEPGQRVELGARLGLLRLDKLESRDAAVDAFEGVLSQEPVHGATVAALERLAEAPEEADEARRALVTRVQRMLEDVYEQGSRFDKLLKVLEARLEDEKDEEEVRRLRLRLAEVSATELGDAAGAYSSLETAFFEQPDDQELWDRLAQAAETAGHQRALANAYATAIEAGELSDDARIELATRAAALYDEVLAQPDEAEPFHKRILEADPLSERSFEALKELYTGAERWDELQSLYRRRIADTTDSESKLDLLLQVCFLFEEILERPDQAIETYQQVLELAPEHGAARRTLERLYEGTERWRDLAELLRGNLDRADGQERVDLMLRLGDLCEHKINEPSEAVTHYESVLTEQPHQLRAQEGLGRLIAVESQRQRVALILEPIYEEQGAYTDLASALEIQLGDAESSSARADLLMRIGELQEQRIRDAEAAFSAFSRAVQAEPENSEARESLARVASGRETFRRERAQVLSRALDGIADGENRDLEVELLQEMAILLDEYLEDRDGAERAYARLLELEKENGEVILAASRALERIHIEREDYGKLVTDLERQVEFEGDDSVRGALLIRIADTHENMLESVDGAIDAHERRVELDPDDEDAMRALERLYESTQRYEKLVEVLRRHAEVAEVDEERRNLGRRAGSIREEHLEDPEGAIEAYADVVASFGPDLPTLTALARLYEARERWQDLLDTLTSQEELTSDVGERSQLQFRMAELMRLHTGEGERALEYYQHVLEYEPAHSGSLNALDAVMADRESDLRQEAARIAAPRYEGNAAFDRLIGVLEVLQDTDNPPDKLEALRRAAEVAENGLSDPSQAFDYAGRALRAGADDPAVGELLGEAARLADAASRHGDYVSLLRDVAPNMYDGDLQPEVYRRIAEVARERLHDVPVALEYYDKLLAERPEDRDALDALEALNEEAGNHAALIKVLGQKAEIAGEDHERARLLARQADIYERRLDDGEAAIGVLEELVIEHPSAESYEALERLYGAAARWQDQAAAFEAMLDRGIGSAVEVRFKLARTCHERLEDTERALEFLREAVAGDISHGGAIELLEGILASGGEHRPGAAEILEPVYLAQSSWEKLTSALEARIEVEDIVDDKKRLLVRLAQLYEDQLEDFDHALEVYARLFAEDPREEETWETLTRLARVGEQWGTLGKILRKPLDADGVEDEQLARLARYAGALYAERIKNQHQAAELFAMALGFDPADREAFDALESSYRELGAWEKILPLYREQAESAESDERRIALLHRAAHVHRDLLEQRDEAVAVYREILEVDAEDADAISGLENLLAQAEDWNALADHLRVRIDRALGGDQEVPLKIRLAELLEQKLEDTAAAIDVYEEIAQVNAQEKNTLWALERLVQDTQHTLRITQILEPIYRQLDQWKKLIAIYEAQIKLVDDALEKGRLLGEVGELHEQRAGDVALAFHAWMRAFTLDPDGTEARGHVDRLAAQMGAWDEHVQAYEAAFGKTDDSGLKSELLTTIARVHDEKRGDPRAAIEVYERLADHDPEDPAALDSLEALLTMVGDWEGMARLLGRRAEQAFDTEERTEMLRRLGSIQEELLGDRDAAIAAYTRAVEEDDTDVLSHEALDRLYSLAQRPDDLGRVLSRRIDLAADGSERITLGLRLGVLFEQELRNDDQAIEAYQRVLDDEPVNAPALAALGKLFERTGQFSELLENLETRTSLAPDDSERVRLLFTAGSVLETDLVDAYEAIERYRQVLEINAAHGESIDALMRITRVPEHRTQAAEIVEPLLRAQERWNDLVELMEAGVGLLEDPYERRGELMRLAEVHEHGRGQPADAFGALCRALREDPGDDNLLADVERLAAELGSWGDLANALSARAPTVPDPTLAADLYRRLGRICEESLGDDARAIDAFVHASEQDDDSRETLADLDRLYTRAERWEELLDVIERRIAATGDPAERTDLLIRIGTVREERFDDARGAFVAFKEVLDGDPADARALEGMERLGQHDALAQDVLDSLDDCYRQTGALEKVAGLYDIRIRLAETEGERMRLLREAAGVWEQELGDPARALQSVRRVFELDPAEDSVLDEIERLADIAGSYEGVRGMIDGLVEGGMLEGQRKRVLVMRAADWYRDRIPTPEAEERCLRWSLEVDAEQSAVHERLTGLLRGPGRERDLVEALRRWAEFEHAGGQRKERLREAATLADGAVGDAAVAGECWTSLLETDADDAQALSELARIRFDAGAHGEAVDLLGRQLAVTEEMETRVALRYRVAEIQAEQLGDADAAIGTLRGLLAEAPDHAASVAALDQALQKAERWRELRELLQGRLERISDGAERTDLRVRLARLAEAQLGDTEGAIAELTGILEEQPGHALAQDELERLYEADERWPALASLLGSRGDAAAQAGDTSGEVALLRRLAALQEERLGDAGAAIGIHERILERDAGDRDALDALLRLQEAAESWGEVVRHLQSLLALLDGDEGIGTAHRLAEVADERLSDTAAAEGALLRALELRPGDGDSRERLKALYEKHELHAKLAQVLADEEPSAPDPKQRVALLNRIAGLYRDQLSDPGAAVGYLERAVELVPDDREALLALCDLYIAAERQRDAIPVLQKIVDSYGGRRAKEVAVYQHRLGQAYEGIGEVEEAMGRYDAAFKIDLTNVLILRDLGRLCLDRGDLERAQKSYRALLLQKLGPDSGIRKADVYFRLGDISSRQGDKVKAKAMLERAISEAGEHAEAQALLDQL